jgi:transposase-like protein
MARFRWTAESERAAQLIADGKLTNQKVADEVGVARQQLDRWKTYPEFRSRVEANVEEFRATVRASGIAQLERRVAALNDRWLKMQTVIEKRAAAYADDDHGGETGLIRRKVSGWVGKGDEREPVYDYEFDAALLKELREHEKQAAQELGQWTEKVQSEVRATLVDPGRQAAMLGSERAIDIACDFDAEINRSRDRGADPGGVRDQGE